MEVLLENINFSYNKSDSGALKNLNLNIKQGECVLLTGPSGCGKTTITRILNGLIPSFYRGNVTGNALLDGKPISQMKSYEIAEHIGSVFQNPRTQFFNVDTDSEIAFGLENNAVPTDSINERIKTVTNSLKIQNLRGRDIFKLSGGEKQKIAFASVYAMAPDIFLLDEPSSNLDAAGIDELAKCLKKVKSEKKTIIISEHRIYYLMDIVDKVVCMKDGKIVNIYTRDEFLKLENSELNSMGIRISHVTDFNKNRNSFGNELKKISSSADNTKCLKVKNLSITRGKRTLLSSLSLEFYPGEIVGITGRNGLGKTTFLRTVTGLYKDFNGEISLDDRVMKSKDLCKESYLVMQDVNYQLFAESVRDECTLGLRNADKTSVDNVLDVLGLLKFADRHPNTLSGGQKQRLSLAVSMISDKRIIALDEPTSGLDYENMVRTSTIVKKLAEQGKIILIVTHDEEFIANCCTRVIKLG